MNSIDHNSGDVKSVQELTNLPLLTPIIAGPTAGGKSDLSVALALAARDQLGIEAEIITADAYQIYKGMDIGTAKPTIEERRGIPHHLIDLVSPHADQPTPDAASPAPTSFTVDNWLTLATAAIADIRARNRFPIVVGGTHLYIKALLDGLFDGPEPDPTLRAELTAMDPALRRAELERVDPAAALRIHPNDIRRTVRALEVFRLTGETISSHQRQWDRPMSETTPPSHPKSEIPNPKFPAFLLILLDWPTEALNRRINSRVHKMFEGGLLAELRALLSKGPLTTQASEALGYKQLLPLLAPGSPIPPPPAAIEAALEQVKIQTRRFAKNQRTWLRRLRTSPDSLTISCPPTPGLASVVQILARSTTETGR